MISLKIKKTPYFIVNTIGFLFCLFVLGSCIDERIDIENPNDPDSNEEIIGDALGFTIALDKSLDTRGFVELGNAVEKKEDWIDMQDKFRVFFFTAEGDFLFGANDRIVGSIENWDGSGTSKDYWYVRIPMTMIVDRKNHEYDINRIKNYLKNNKFKVAVLANWPNAGAKVNPGDYDDSSDNIFSQNPSSTLKGEPLWGWENSILYKELYDSLTEEEKKTLAKNIGEPDVKNLNDLHHIYEDTYYSDETQSSGRPSRLNVYGNFMKNYTDNSGKTYKGMGQPTDWVKMRDLKEGWKYQKSGCPSIGFESKETANQWIRAFWDPSVQVNEDKNIYRHYQHLWFLWNFNATYTVGKSNNIESTVLSAYGNNYGWNDGKTIGNSTNKWGKEWWERNGKDMYNNWFKGHENNLDNHSLITQGNPTNAAYMSFKKPQSSSAQLVSVSIDNVPRYGIKLPVMENQGTGSDGTTKIARTDDSSHGYFKFLARTSGTLRIKWGSADGNQAKIMIQKGGTKDKEYTVESGNAGKWFDIGGTGSTDTYRDFSIGGNSENIYIWCSQGNAVIYAIEYIRGKYLYDTDREGYMPDEEQGIPMYGVKEYEPISEWEYGTTHNLDGIVSLIRSLAKVVVYLPYIENNPPSHVYMRSMNRTAHCEPMDLFTDTDILWDENNHDNEHCEWFNIISYGPEYQYAKTTDVNDNTELEAYKKYLSWFYGSWKNWWDFKGVNNNSFTVADDNQRKIENRKDGYPHLFNPHINRSDFCSFLYVGVINNQGQNFHKFVLYVPDKNIDDPNYPGIFSCTPKVPHIEYRFANETSDKPQSAASDYSNTEFNLDDNDCYRIYFTNYGYDSSFNTNSGTEENTEIRSYSRASYDTYEKNGEHLKKHWPIMRNHIYEFYVSGSAPETQKIAVKVSDWGHEKVVVKW